MSEQVPPSAASQPDPLAKARHDLRTPINQIIGYGELLLEQAEEDGLAAYSDDLKRIVTAARNQLSLLEVYLAPALAPSSKAASAVQPAPGQPAAPTAPASAKGPATQPAPDLRAELGSQRARLLVVDDNEANRDMLSRRLARTHQVLVAEAGSEALALIDSQPFDLVLLDVMMPGISGLEVLRQVRQTRSMADLPVIMATAMDGSADVVEALRLGANDYVTKPLDFPVVQARVETQLALKRQKEQIQRLVDDLDKRNRFIREAFGRYLSDEVVENLLVSPDGLKLGGESRTVTILMSDLRGFTALSERLGPEQVVRLLNRFLERMTDVIFAHGGTIDELLGDAILTIFGAPEHRADDAARAVRCAISMQRAMADVNAENKLEGLPPLEMGIGIHTGRVVVGNIGSSKRTKYGVVGPPVNATGRIESLTVGGQILISDETRRAAAEDLVLGAPVTVRAKGAKEEMLVFPLKGILGPAALHVPESEEALLPLRAEALLRCFVVEGKHTAESSFAAALTHLSSVGARARLERPSEALANLKLVLEGGVDVYAKVLETDAAGTTVRLRFTAVPEEATPILRALSA